MTRQAALLAAGQLMGGTDRKPGHARGTILGECPVRVRFAKAIVDTRCLILIPSAR